MISLTCWLLLLLPFFSDGYTRPLSRSIVTLFPQNLVAFYPLLVDLNDYAPYGTTNGYTQNGYTQQSLPLHITEELGLRLERDTRVEFPINIHPRNFPNLTIGAWIRVNDSMIGTKGCLFSQNGSSLGRALCVDRGQWILKNQVIQGVTVLFNQWCFIAIVFTQSFTTFFINGELLFYGDDDNNKTNSIVSPLVVIGAANNDVAAAPGFIGSLQSFFLFDMALSSTELTTLMTMEDVAMPMLEYKDNISVDTNDKTLSNSSNNPGYDLFPFWSLEPANRIVHIGSMVTVYGSPPFDTQLSRCRLNDSILIFPFQTTSASLTCEIPAIPLNGYAIELFLSRNAVDFISIGYFHLRPRPWIARVSPHVLLRSKTAQQVDVFGMNFVNSTALTCFLGQSLPTVATFLSSSRIQCNIEPLRLDSSFESLEVAVSVNRVDISIPSKQNLSLVNLPFVTQLLPSNGPIGGGTSVTIRGTLFRDDMRYSVTYNQLVTELEYINATTLRWKTHGNNETGWVQLTFLIDNKAVPDLASFSFLFTVPPRLSSVFPELVSLDSDTFFTLSGHGFAPVSSLSCSFSIFDTETTTAATFLSSFLIQCRLPRFNPTRFVGVYHLVVSNNGQDFSPLSEALQVRVHSVLRLDHASILTGPSTGGTRVTLTGTNLIVSSTVVCQFGSTRSRGIVFSETTMQCIAPAWTQGRISNGIDPVVLSVSLNGVDFTRSKLLFHYYAPPLIQTLVPSLVPVNTTVSILLSGNYLVAYGTVSCRFGTSLVVLGSVQAGGRTIECAAVTISTLGWIQVSLALNNVDFTKSCVKLYVHAPVILTSVDQPLILKDSTRLLSVYGHGFIETKNNVFCAFGSILTSGNVLSSDVLTCRLPLNLSSGATYPVRVSFNQGVHFSRPEKQDVQVAIYDWPRFDSIVSRFNAVIHVQGSGFIVNHTVVLPIVCVYDDAIQAMAHVVNATSLSCPLNELESTRNKTRSVAFQIESTSLSSTKLPFPSAVVRPRFKPQLVEIEPTIVLRGTRTKLTLRGRFFASNATFCHFSTQIKTPKVAIVTSSDVASCWFESSGVEGSVTLSLSRDGIQPSSSISVAFMVVEQPLLTSLWPRKGSIHGNTTLRVTGSGYVSYLAMYCHFGDQDDGVLATVLTPTTLTCVTPRRRRIIGGDVDLRVSIDVTVFSTTKLTFLFDDGPQLMSLTPLYGSVYGGNPVTLKGKRLNASEDIVTCVFGTSTVTPGVILNATDVKLDVPLSQDLGHVTVQCQVNTESTTRFTELYHYLAPPHVSSIVPNRGLLSIETPVVVTGHGFHRDFPLSCSFGNLHRPATILSSGTLQCLAPSQSTIGIVPFTLTFQENFSSFSDSMIRFEYLAEPQLDHVMPPFGAASTSTRLLIHGAHFAPPAALRCGFTFTRESTTEIVFTSVVRANNASLVCFTPLFPPGVAKLQLAVGDKLGGSTLYFTFTLAPRIVSLFPERSAGASDVVVLITGRGFIHSRLFQCSLGESNGHVVEFVNETQVRCRFPRSFRTGKKLPVHVSNNQQDVSPDIVLFEWDLPIEIDSIKPSSGWIHEKTTRIVLVGNHFHPQATLVCELIKNTDRIETGTLTITNATTAECILPTPRAVSILKESTFRFQVRELTQSWLLFDTWFEYFNQSIDHDDIFESLTMETQDKRTIKVPPLLSFLRPLSGLPSGGTRVFLHGGPFQLDGDYTCHFGQAVAPANVLSTSHLYCLSPASRHGASNVSLTLSGRAFSSLPSRWVFLYQEAPRVKHVTPSRGSERGNELVTIQGEFFKRGVGLRVRFGFNDIVVAQWLSETAISCRVPRHVPGWVTISVTNNLQDYSIDSVQFEYVLLMPFPSPVDSVQLDSMMKKEWKLQPREAKRERIVALKQLEPSIGSVNGGTVVTITGQWFHDDDEVLFCILNEHRVQAEVWSTSMLQCRVPASTNGPQHVQMFVAMKGELQRSLSLGFSYHEHPQVLRIEPTSGPTTGSTLVHIFGTSFFATRWSVCSFGDRFVRANVQNATYVTCLISPSTWKSVGALRVRYSSNGQEFSHENVTYSLYHVPSLVNWSPRVGSVRGGTRLSLEWNETLAFVDVAQLSCQMGPFLVKGVRVRGKTLTMSVPAAYNGQEGAVAIRVAFNGQNYIDGPRFWYVQEPIIQSLGPISRDQAGRPWIKVIGRHFPRLLTLKCVFGARMIMMSAAWESNQAVRCQVPSLDHSVAFGFSLNGVDVIETTLQVTFEFKSPSRLGLLPASTNSLELIFHPRRLDSFHILDMKPRHALIHQHVNVVLRLSRLLEDNETWTCRVGETIAPIAAVMLSRWTIKCLLPVRSFPGPVLVSVSSNIVDEARGGLNTTLTYHMPPRVTSLSRDRGSVLGGDLIVLYGHHFNPELPLVAVFETQIVDLVYRNASAVACLVPPSQRSPRAVTFRIGLDLNVASVYELLEHDLELVWTYEAWTDNDVVVSNAPLTLLARFPPLGLSIGGLPVQINVQHAPSRGNFSCIFDTIRVPAERTLATQFQCTSPAHRPGSVVFGLEEEEALPPASSSSSSSSSLSFTYIPSVAIVDVVPSRGSPLGGTTVVLKLSHRLDPVISLSAVRCRFDTTLVEVVAMHDKHLTCISPLGRSNQAVPLALSLYGHEIATSLTRFQYFKFRVLDAIEPRHGPRQGTINVTAFINDLETNKAAIVYACGLETSGQLLQFSSARVLSSGHLQCPVSFDAPELESVHVSIWQNGERYSINSLPLELFLAPRIERVVPMTLIATGGSVVRVLGTHFSSLELFTCRFGETQDTIAHVLSSELLECLSPPLEPGNSTFCLVSTRTTLVTSSVVSLTIVAAFTLESIAPTEGWRQEATLVRVRGAHFYPELALACRFGDQRTPATYISSIELHCEAPLLSTQASSRYQVDVFVTVNGKVLVDAKAVTFTYYAMPSFETMIPRAGSVAGGTRVVVHGTMVPTLPYTCFFHGLGQMTAIVWNSSTLACFSPPSQAPARVQVEIVALGRAIESDHVFSFTFYASPVILSISPSTLSTLSSHEIQVKGRHFMATTALACRFETGAVIQATFISFSMILCHVPPRILPGCVVAMEMTLNGVEYTTNQQKLTFVESRERLHPVIQAIQPLQEGANTSMTSDEDQLPVITTQERSHVSKSKQMKSLAFFYTDSMVQAEKKPIFGPFEGNTRVHGFENDVAVDSRSRFTFDVPPRLTLESVYPSIVSFPAMASTRQVELVITGTGFIETAQETTRCRVGDQGSGESVVWISTTRLLCFPPALRAGTYSLQVALNGVDFTNDRLALVYAQDVHLLRLTPSFGVVSGNTRVQLEGLHFSVASEFMCVFGTKISRLNVLNASHADCISPSQLSTGSVAFSIAPLASFKSFPMTATSSEWTFVYHHVPVLTKIIPSIVFSTSVSRLRLVGVNFLDTALLTCSIDGFLVPARFLAAYMVECVVYPVKRRTKWWRSGRRVPVEVSNNGQDFSNSELEIRIESPLHLLRLEPDKGFCRHVHTVKIQVEPLSPWYQQLTCLVGETHVVQARKVSDEWIECTLPALSSSTSVNVSVAVDGLEYSSSSLRFTYVEIFESSRTFKLDDGGPFAYTKLPLDPSFRLAINHSSVVTVDKEEEEIGRVLTTWWNVHDDIVMQEAANHSTLSHFHSPAAFLDHRNVDISSRNESLPYFSSTSLDTIETKENEEEEEDFSWLETMANVVSVEPSRGPIRGGTRVVFTLARSWSFPLVFCRFGQDVVPGFIPLSTRELHCISPKRAIAEVVELTIGPDSLQFDPHVTLFKYLDNLSVLMHLTPLHGTVRGGTLLDIFLGSVDLDAPYSCQIGQQIVSAAYTNTSHIGCRTPAVSRPAQVAVRISDNGVDFTSLALAFTYTFPPFVTRIEPESGDRRGNQQVKIMGGHFLVDQETISCRFGDLVTSGTVLSASTALCRALDLLPRHDLQRLRLTTSSFVPEIQRMTLSSSPLQATVQEITTLGERRRPEIQQFTVSGDLVRPIQAVYLHSQAYGGELFTLVSSISSLVHEVQWIDLRATTFLGGSFRLVMENHSTSLLTSHATEEQVQAALETLENVGHVSVTKQTLGLLGSCTWMIEFLDRVGDLPLLEIENLSLGDSGSADLSIVVREVVKGQGAPLSGTFCLVIDGQRTRPMRYDATEETMLQSLQSLSTSKDILHVQRRGPFLNNAYEWRLTFAGFPSHVREIKTMTRYLAQGRGEIHVLLVSPGAKSEQQQLSTVSTSGSFTCELDSRVTRGIPVTASAMEVVEAFESATFGRVQVAGDAGGPWIVTFVDWAGDLPLLKCGEDQRVVQVTAGTGRALTGTFSLKFHGHVTSPLAFNATPAELAVALKTFDTDVNVTMVSQDVNGGGNWLITFSGVDGNVALFESVNVDLEGENVHVEVNEVQRGNELHGWLAFEWNNEKSASFQVNASVEEITRIVAQMEGIGERVDVTRTQLSSGLETIFTVTFSNEWGDLTPLKLVDEGLVGQGVTLTSRTIQDGGQPIAGTFTLSYGGFATPALPWNVSSEDMAIAIQWLQSIPFDDGVYVTRSGPNEAGGMTWTVTFPLGMQLPSPLLSVTYRETLSGSSVNMQVTLLSEETKQLEGWFQLGAYDQSTAAFDVQDSSIVALEKELEHLLSFASVDATRLQTGNSIQWDLTFLSLDAAIASPVLLTIETANVSGTNVSAHVERVQEAVHSEIQSISISQSIVLSRQEFYIVWNDERSTLLASSWMFADEFKTVLATIPGLDVTIVERSPSALGIGFTWLVLITESSRITTPIPFSLEFVNATLPSDLIVTITSYPSTVSPLSGTFTISSRRETCVELTLGAYCTPEESAALSVDIDAESLAHELSLFQGLEGTTVSFGHVFSPWNHEWLLTFPFTSFDMPLLEVNDTGIGSSFVSVEMTRLEQGNGMNEVNVALEVSLNGQDYSTSDVLYRYTPLPQISSLDPSHGPLDGATHVLVSGTHFFNTSRLRCRFGERITATAAAIFLNSTHVTCVAPMALEAGDVDVEVANHGVFKLPTSKSLVFTYDPELILTSVFPSRGSTTGNFTVQLTGGPFRQTDTLQCKFTDVVVPGTWQSYDEMTCIAPAHGPGLSTLQVTRNGQDYTGPRLPFVYYMEQRLHALSPTFGPAYAAGTAIEVSGVAFVNSSLLACRFGYVVTPGEYLSPRKIRCTSPPVSSFSSGLRFASYGNEWIDPAMESTALFPTSQAYPFNLTRLVSFEVSNNQQDFSHSGLTFLYYHDESLDSIVPTQAFDQLEPLVIFAYGHHFLNTSALTCRLGLATFQATFVTSNLLQCAITVFDDTFRANSSAFDAWIQPHHVRFQVSNNGQDFTTNDVVFQFLGPCPTGYYCPNHVHGKLPCPRGTYCPGVANRIFTPCPRGTYQPQAAQAACHRCPIGYHCPFPGLDVPHLCPAGFVCDVTGIEEATEPCPEGHFCLEGTATTATTCTPTTSYTGMLTASFSAATVRHPRAFASVQARKSGCWRNETTDFGLQVSAQPSRFWMERRQVPEASVDTPRRGRFCLDDACVQRLDRDHLVVHDVSFDYQTTGFVLRRPVPCPAGMYCQPGAAANVSILQNISTAQPCFKSMYCPEGSSSPRGFGECPRGFYCPFGTRISCPAGTYCPDTGHISPWPCPPGTFNAMVAQSTCTACPVGFVCPGYGRLLPALCAPGYVCSQPSLASPNSLCPRGFYCLEGTATSDGFRNDTRLRPYPCRPGTYCLKGVVADEIRAGDYRYPQNCTAGFYCEVASYSPKGSGLCPRGFTCPSGTAVPIPTAKGTYAQLEGTISAADCAPGYYAPTIESIECLPCPPGTTCANDGTAIATSCPPGTYRGSVNADGLACLACPQGTWSKNWELRGVEECLACAPGTVCPIEGITNPCTLHDLPRVYTPMRTNETFAQCQERGATYFFGVLLEPWIDELGRGVHLVPDRDHGQCYENTQPQGSELYQRMAAFYGPLYEISSGTGVPHQGYGNGGQNPPPTLFGRGSLAIDLTVSKAFDVARNCTAGFYYKTQWFPGTCEADVICSTAITTTVQAEGDDDDDLAQAQPCPEGYVCDASTTADDVFLHPCPAGYVCGPGTTPDLTLEAPRGQLGILCPAGRFCLAGTAEAQKDRGMCPAGYFCPTGTGNPVLGQVANDALRRRLSSIDSNPFLWRNFTKYLGEGDIRVVSAHDLRCFDGIDEDLSKRFELRQDPRHRIVVVNRATERNRLCARDHKWRTVELALQRQDCDCVAQMKLVRRVFQLWKCTVVPSSPKDRGYAPKRYGWHIAHNSAFQCVFLDPIDSIVVNLTALVGDGGSGVRFQTTWTENTSVHSYAELRTLVEEKFAAQTGGIDPYVYDLHHAIEMIEMFGDETLEFAGFVAGSKEESETDLVRLDACACAQMFKCPNGTTSPAGSDSIYQCVRLGNQVLRRLSPLPLSSDRVLNGSAFQDLTGLSGRGLGTIVLEPFEVAVVTINTTQLERNLTYGAHYQLSVYQDCKPCPPRYQCDLTNEPPTCTYPDNDLSTATRLYDKCLALYNGDRFVCNTMPYFCEARTLPLAQVSRTAAARRSNETITLPGCCSCERLQMPYYFENTASDRSFPDNKHGYLQFSVAALDRAEITIAVELFHGLYVSAFARGFTSDRFDLMVFTPGRATSSPSTSAFLAFILESNMDNLMLPLNLPEEYARVPGTLTYKQQVVKKVLIDRMSDIFVGDPDLPSKRGFSRITEQAQLKSNGSVETSATVVTRTNYFGLYPVADPFEVVLRSSTWWTKEFEGETFLALPYLPYFSSCRGFDSNLFLAKMVETHPDCTFVSSNETIEVDQYPWRQKLTPHADKCIIEYSAEVVSSNSSFITSKATTKVATFERGVSLSCLYEENLEGGADKVRWYEAPTGTVLFHITRDPTAAEVYRAKDGVGWGRSGTLENYIGTDALIPVTVGERSGLPLVVPQEVSLDLRYYQITRGQKRLVEAFVNFGNLCAITRSVDLLATLAKRKIYPCVSSTDSNQVLSKEYTLFVSWKPLNWFELMNRFQFTGDVYLGFFTLVALASMMLGFAIWIFNRLLTKMEQPPSFRLTLLLQNVALSPPIGIVFAILPIVVACLVIYLWWHVFASTTPLVTPNVVSFENMAGDWLDQVSLDKLRVRNYKRGRIGWSLLVMGMYLLVLGSRLLVPETMDLNQEDNAFNELASATPIDPFVVPAESSDKEEENEFWGPRAWKRANVLLTTIGCLLPMLIFWEFSYSSTFTKSIYAYLVLFKVLRAVMECVLESFLHEKLLVLPFAVVLSVSESMMGMGTTDFINFTLFYFVNLGLTMIEHLYTAPLVRRQRALWPKRKLALQRRLQQRRRRTPDEKAQDEAEWQLVCAQIESQMAGVEPVLEGMAGYSVVFTELFMAPILLAFQALFSVDTEMPALYGVGQTDLQYYVLFSMFIIPSNLVVGALQLHTMELAHGWKLYDYTVYQRHRFATRDTRWPLAHATADESIHPSYQSLDLLCFSSQLYFLLTIYSSGILLTMLGISVCLRARYSLFGDPIALVIIVLICALMRALEVAWIRLGDKCKIWIPRNHVETAGDEDETLAAKLALRQQEQEHERLEVQALNSERFRHRFLERNQPWVMQHLAELFTPRTLQATHDPAGEGHTTAAYVRDLYRQLVNMGEGRRLPDDRSDISSDSEDEMENMRRVWSNDPPVQGALRELALYWLAKARKQREFKNLVAAFISAGRQNECVICSRREDGGFTLHVDLAAANGAKRHDPRALDRLINSFERKFATQELDTDLWKAYFRKHATFLTLCNVCMTATEPGLKNTKLVADVSSDESSDQDERDVRFAPLVVTRASIEGRILSEWLSAARKRLGEPSPRQEEMAHTTRKLKSARQRAGKTESDDEDKQPSRFSRPELSETARALATRWIWTARDRRDAEARKIT